MAVLATPLLAAAQGGDVAAQFAEGDRFLSAGNVAAAIGAYRRALDAGADLSHDSLHSRNLGRAYLGTATPDYAQAARWLQHAVILDPTDDGRVLLARAHSGMGAHEAAADDYRMLSLAHPQNPDYILGCARELRRAGKVDAALDWMRTALERSAGLASVRVEYGRLLAFQRQLPEAKRQFESVLASDPENLGAQIGLAKVTSWQGDQDSALRLYERILRRNAGLYDALVGKSFSLLWSGRGEEARSLLVQAARRHPEDEDVREALLSMGVAVPQSEAKGKTEQPLPTRAAVLRIPVKAVTAPRWTGAVPSAKQQPAPVPVRAAAPPAQRAGADRVLDKLLNRKTAWTAGILGSLSLLVIVLAGTLPRRSRPATVQVMRVILPLRDASPHRAQPPRVRAQPAAAAKQPAQSADPICDVVKAEPATQQEHAIEQRTAPVADISRDCLAGTKITLIGNNQAVLQFESRVLRTAGAEVAAFESWNAALATVNGSEPDLLVLNPLTADGWTALTMCAWLNANRPDLVRRTVVTISVRDEEADEFCRTHIGACLYQPFGVNEFLGTICALRERIAAPPPPQHVASQFGAMAGA